MSESRGGRSKRSYRPRVEGLESLRLLAGAAALPLGVPIAIDPAGGGVPASSGSGAFAAEAWDEALLQSQVADLVGPAGATSTTTADAEAIASGLAQLDRYLGRAWARAGIAPQQHDDCTQAVYASLLQSLGRDRFDGLLTEIGDSGIREVLSRETAEGPDFFRAVDAVKKRAQREKTFQPIDAVEVADVSATAAGQADWSGALREAIERSLSPREAALIQATIRGETPAEIAQRWGVAPKTVSNEKSRALQKLRDALGSDLDPGERAQAPASSPRDASTGEAAPAAASGDGADSAGSGAAGGGAASAA